MATRPQTLYGFDPDRIDWMNPKLSFKTLKESVESYCSRLREANAESAFGQLLRAGIQTFAINSYLLVPVVYPDLCTEVGSSRRQEFYAPLYRPNLPKRVEAGEPFQESKAIGVDRELINFKFGFIESFERELFDDDQTGQIKNRASLMGENFRILEEIYVMGKIVGSGLTSQGVIVPASTLSDGVYTVAKGNRPTGAFARITQPGLEAGDIALMNIADPLGNKFLVTPTTVLGSPADKFVIAKLLNSALQPSVPTTTAGDTGYVMTANPLQGLYTMKISRYLPSGAWFLGDFKKGLVFQRRDPLEVIQENPASGASFIQDVFKFRTRSRFEVDWIESRFVFEGDDGSV